MSNADEGPDIWELALAVLIPINLTVVLEFLEDVRERSGDASTVSFVHRIQGISLLILVVGVFLLVPLLLVKRSLNLSIFGFLGVQSSIAIGIFASLLVMQLLVSLTVNIEKGRSVISFNEKNRWITAILRFALGFGLLAAVSQFYLASSSSMSQIILLLVVSCFTVGATVAGISTVASGLISVLQ